MLPSDPANQKWDIELKDVYKSFGNKHVLQGLNLKIYDGETFVILGPSGCGKSVTLRIITGLLKADKGSVFVAGSEISQFTQKQFDAIRIHFGMLFQNAALFDSMTVGDNVAFGLRTHGEKNEEIVRQKVQLNLTRVGLPGIEHKMPSELSGGMRKRVGLARAIALEPKVIFYDEPTTGLDPVMSTGIDLLVIKMQKELKATSVVITHDLKSAFRIANRVGLHFNGQIIEIGTPEEFQRSRNPVVRQFLEGSIEGPIGS